MRNVPIIHTAVIPGCESYNARYFSGHGMSVWAQTTEEMLRMADDILAHGDKSAGMAACQRKWINPHAAADICDLAEKLVAEQS